MNDIRNIDPNIASTLATRTGQAEQAQPAAEAAAPILSGQSVTVTSAAASDLEKLVAQLKNENDDRAASMAKRRLASLLDVYTARHGELSARQTRVLQEIAANNDSIAGLTEELKKVLADLAAAEGRSTVMQSKIESLERAVAQAVEDGKAHREAIAKLKAQIAADADNEDLKARLAKEEKALENSEKALSKARTDLAGAQAAAGAIAAEIRSLAASADKLKADIAGLKSANAALAAKIDPQTISGLLAAFEEEASAAPAGRNTSAAEEEKAERKAIANDPANILREAMDRMDEAILRTIDENRDKTV